MDASECVSSGAPMGVFEPVDRSVEMTFGEFVPVSHVGGDTSVDDSVGFPLDSGSRQDPISITSDGVDNMFVDMSGQVAGAIQASGENFSALDFAQSELASCPLDQCEASAPISSKPSSVGNPSGCSLHGYVPSGGGMGGPSTIPYLAKPSNNSVLEPVPGNLANAASDKSFGKSSGHDNLNGSFPSADQGVTGKAGPNVWHKKFPIKVLRPFAKLEISLDGVSVHMNEGNVDGNIAKLDCAVVGKLMGRAVPFQVLKTELSRRWADIGSFKLVLLDNCCFLALFANQLERDRVFAEGPWVVAGSIIGMDIWSPKFSPET